MNEIRKGTPATFVTGKAGTGNSTIIGFLLPPDADGKRDGGLSFWADAFPKAENQLALQFIFGGFDARPSVGGASNLKPRRIEARNF